MFDHSPVFHVKHLDSVGFDKIGALCALIRRWNGTVRLVSRNDCAVLESRHVANCLALVPIIKHLRPRSILDLGSGGGFPGLVVAIATGYPVHLVEADQRKAEFLREATRSLGLTAAVHAMRADMVDMQVEIVTARAVAPLPQLWRMARPLLTPGGTGLFLKGRSVEVEMRATLAETLASGLVWSFPDGTIVELNTPR